MERQFGVPDQVVTKSIPKGFSSTRTGVAKSKVESGVAGSDRKILKK